MYGRTVVVFAGIFVALGVALVVETARAGGGVGYLIGVLFVALGIGRLVLHQRRRR